LVSATSIPRKPMFLVSILSLAKILLLCFRQKDVYEV